MTAHWVMQTPGNSLSDVDAHLVANTMAATETETKA